ncbi:hypothetical protein [Persicitalea jodogahamensis]|uniref:Uncharacterized protein n=1 Tax=Persicitalea jodogahamensis TaxID=402147 RepID=A0A8J3GA52_9BACT|nr:hypothetical protein [Persicitalea jodogahamensis]GHB71733.1 hypothetical protein GCM10007390_27020 [Persicitalea jodogahamensis]
MKPYSEYSAEELAMERLFIRWVRHPDDPHVSKFWVNWVQENPQQTETVESAKMLVDTVSDWEETEMSSEERTSLWELIRQSIGSIPSLVESGRQGVAPVENWSFLKWSIGIVTTVILLFLFIRETPLYTNNAESQNTKASPIDVISPAQADTSRSYSYPDSTKNKIGIK